MVPAATRTTMAAPTVKAFMGEILEATATKAATTPTTPTPPAMAEAAKCLTGNFHRARPRHGEAEVLLQAMAAPVAPPPAIGVQAGCRPAATSRMASRLRVPSSRSPSRPMRRLWAACRGTITMQVLRRASEVAATCSVATAAWARSMAAQATTAPCRASCMATASPAASGLRRRRASPRPRLGLAAAVVDRRLWMPAVREVLPRPRRSHRRTPQAIGSVPPRRHTLAPPFPELPAPKNRPTSLQRLRRLRDHQL
mmetsp:Transcript_95436/g.274902  ORF Transcript_95436/g.274902 Transcript_95436/m.274902 type:complete len:255 (-) Transcript_95436:103-867(-)